ncbi:DsbA family protein [Candidatus Anaplasma sp. TIGMIC]|uniref:DsbA family protein n=1 Tax=Candidatus Anaplasma sp. TIGMIC TaxID=3020713 RepID=UPI00232B533F|nr:DsbA family protein [Candidatus Anaplasma sp. TIGMIC]MDB1135120.1 DsbA family protein [Candidatus Anaplasma sp. TIGMIC]
MGRLLCLLGLVVLVASFPLISRWVSGVRHQNRQEIEAIIEEYIYKNPHKVVSALSKGQVAINKTEMRKRVQENREELADEAYPVFGNKKSDVVLVEFFDYSCGYCRTMLPHIREILSDGKARVIFRDLPLLGDASMLAARAALAVHFLNPEKYIDFHYATMVYNKKFDEEEIAEIIASIGIAYEDFEKSLVQNDEKITKMLSDTKGLVAKLNIGGTPSVVVGDTVFVGSSDLQTLRDMIQSAADAKRNK